MSAEQLTEYLDAIPWLPQKGPQQEAMLSKADVVLYGGAAGGGKTALACGISVTRAEHSLIMRREATQLKGIIREIGDIIDKDRVGYSKQNGEWKIPRWDGVERTVMFGSCPHLGDENKWQGIARDYLVLDEAANFLESQAKFLMGWTRSTTKYDVDEGNEGYLTDRQRTRVLLCSNPPTTSEGQWLKEMFAAWLDPNHLNPAAPGELRYYTTIAGKMEEQVSGEPIENPSPFGEEDKFIYPKSFTFISAKVTDNKFLGADYLRELQALPDTLRQQMLFGDWMSGQEDGEWQVIPSEWVDQAMVRWQERLFNPIKIVSAGLDPSRGGRDSTVLACREDWHYHELQEWEGHEVPDGQTVAAKVIELLGISACPVHTDVIGIGASVVDILGMYINNRVVPINVAEGAKDETDWSGTLKFGNKRAQLWWAFRDILNPANGFNVSLPRDQQLKAELCSPTYQLKANGIMIESKKEIIKRLGRSTDRADAVIMAAERTAILNMTGLSGRVQVNR